MDWAFHTNVYWSYKETIPSNYVNCTTVKSHWWCCSCSELETEQLNNIQIIRKQQVQMFCFETSEGRIIHTSRYVIWSIFWRRFKRRNTRQTRKQLQVVSQGKYPNSLRVGNFLKERSNKEQLFALLAEKIAEDRSDGKTIVSTKGKTLPHLRSLLKQLTFHRATNRKLTLECFYT